MNFDELDISGFVTDTFFLNCMNPIYYFWLLSEIKKITYETLTPKWAPDENLNFEFVPASSKNVKRLIIFKRHKIFGNDAVAKCRVRNKLVRGTN